MIKNIFTGVLTTLITCTWFSEGIAYSSYDGKIHLHNQSGCPITFNVTNTGAAQVTNYQNTFVMEANSKKVIDYKVYASYDPTLGKKAYCLQTSSSSNSWKVSASGTIYIPLEEADIPDGIEISEGLSIAHQEYSSKYACEAAISGQITHGIDDGAGIQLSGYSNITIKGSGNYTLLQPKNDEKTHIIDIAMTKNSRNTVLWSSLLKNNELYVQTKEFNNYKVTVPYNTNNTNDIVAPNFFGYFSNVYISFGSKLKNCIIDLNQ